MSELLTSFRHELHAHPELAHAEHATADRVVAFMQKFNPTEIVTGIAGTGVVVTFDSGVEGPRMLFRCELDALPIVETGVITRERDLGIRRTGNAYLDRHTRRMSKCFVSEGYYSERLLLEHLPHLLMNGIHGLSGLTITFNWTILPSSSHVIMSTPLTALPSTVVSNSSIAWCPSTISS